MVVAEFDSQHRNRHATTYVLICVNIRERVRTCATELSLLAKVHYVWLHVAG